MTNSIYEKIKSFMKKNGKIFVVYILLLLFISVPLPYYIDRPGGAINIKEKIKMEDAYSSSGGFFYGYVSEMRATIPLYLYTFFNKDWTLLEKEDITYDNETIKESNLRSKILMEEANSNAVIMAYQKSGKSVEIVSEAYYVTYIDESADTDLKIGDQILGINGYEIQSRDELYQEIRNTEENEKVIFKVKQDGEEKEKYGIIQKIEGISLVGVTISTVRQYETDPSIEIITNKNESGPSGGLMLTLTIYDMLTEEDLTHGYKIVGTGTIEEDGSVGAIGGVEYKLKGAVKENADIFLVPSGDNYQDAIELKKERNYDIEIVEISNLDEAIAYLKGL